MKYPQVKRKFFSFDYFYGLKIFVIGINEDIEISFCHHGRDFEKAKLPLVYKIVPKFLCGNRKWEVVPVRRQVFLMQKYPDRAICRRFEGGGVFDKKANQF